MIPFVSVIIPVYNAEKYLRACLDSVVAQSLREIEIICVDDGSTDASAAILREYAARDPRVRVITQENRYAGAARNAGMKIARGDYLSFLDADDVFEPDMLRKMFLDAETRAADVVICRADRFSDSLEARTPAPWTVRTELLDVPATTVFSYKNFRRDAFTFCIGWTWDKLFSRRFVEAQGLTFSETRSTNDAYFTFLAVLFARRISFVDRVLVHQRERFDSLSRTREKDPLCYWQVVRDMKHAILARPGLWDEVGDAFMRWLAGFALWQAESLAPDARERQIAYFRDVAAPEFDFLSWLDLNAFTPEMRRVRSWLTDAPPPPLVSVIIPVYNVEKYLRECLDSVVNQTLRDIEIICVNDGSTDSSLKILEEYASKDSRIKIISRENKGYGFSVNEGIDSSHGRYIGIIEPDDFAELSMYEKLVEAAQEFNRPWVVCFYYLYEETKRRPCYQFNSWRPSKPILLNPKANTDCVIFGPAIWAAIYDRRWLNENNIRCLESPGASFQDTGFSIKCFLAAETVLYIPEILLNYRISNPNSSVKDKRKLFCVFDEFEEIERWMERRKISSKENWALVLRRKFYAYKWNESRVDIHSRQELFEKSRLEFSESLKRFHGERPKGIPEQEWTEILCRVKNIPLVSVVVPVYNVEKYLRECLDSICGQTLKNIEIICVNDGSTDGSLAILEEYASRDSRMRIISQENRGLSAARNAGLSVARGKYIYFMDSDDVSPQGSLGKMFAEMEKNSLDVLLFGAESFFESEDLEKAHPGYKTLYKRRPFETQSGQSLVLAFKNAGCGFSPSACCYCSTRRFLNENSIRFPEGILYEDNVFFWKMILAAKRAKSISDALFRRRVRAGSTMTNKKISFRNFKSYATVVFELEKLKEKFSGTAIVEVLRGYARGNSETLVRFYREISTEDRARSRELLAGVLKDSAWLDVVRERVAEIDAGKNGIRADSRESAVKPSGKSAGKAASRLPRFVVRLGALFILNKAARKRWRERHMDLTPRDGIDVNAHPELRRDSALKRFAVRAASLFIFSKKKRKAFRARHLNLTPRDGVDVRALSSQELARLREAKRSHSVLWRIFDALIPATRGKIAHAERHLLRATEEQTRILLDELRRVREDAAETRRELARLREEQERSREELLLRMLALKRSARDAEENLQARLEQVSERMKTALERGKIDKIEKTADRMEAWLDYSLLGDALPGFREKLRESIPTASRESLDELFRTGTDSPCVADCRNRLVARIRSAFSYKDAAYYERVPVAERERELKLWFKLRSGCDLDLENPKTFNEKIQWLKLYDSTPLKTRLADKYEARAWIKEKIGEKYLIPLLGVWDSFDEIDFDKLPEKFVLKTTHGSGYNVVVKDKSKFDKAEAKKKITDWLSRKFEYQGGFEMHYAGIKPRVIAEEFLDIDESGAYEWQAFCFNGKPKFILVIEGGAHAGVPGRRYYYDTNWKKLPFTSLADSLPEGEIEMPERFSEFMDCAKKLAADFLHVRVDFYLLRDGSWKAGELTFTTASGQMRIYPKSYDRVIGDMLELPTDRP